MRLAEHVAVAVWFATERDSVVSYSVVLLTVHEGRWQTVRVYDNAHGHNEMHRFTLRGGKEAGEVFSQEGDFGVAMRAAREEVLAGYEKMIEGWRR
jgi:hypothetical protein